MELDAWNSAQNESLTATANKQFKKNEKKKKKMQNGKDKWIVEISWNFSQ